MSADSCYGHWTRHFRVDTAHPCRGTRRLHELHRQDRRDRGLDPGEGIAGVPDTLQPVGHLGVRRESCLTRCPLARRRLTRRRPLAGRSATSRGGRGGERFSPHRRRCIHEYRHRTGDRAARGGRASRGMVWGDRQGWSRRRSSTGGRTVRKAVFGSCRRRARAGRALVRAAQARREAAGDRGLSSPWGCGRPIPAHGN